MRPQTVEKKHWLFGIKIVRQKITFLKSKPEKLLITKVRPPKTNPNKPENKAEKLLKTRSCGKNKPENKPGHAVENS